MPGVSGSFDPELRIGPESPRSFWQKMADLIREDPKKLIARSQNAYAYSQMFGITPSEAYDYSDFIDEKIFGEELTTPELLEGLAILPITAALASNPLGVLLGFGTFMSMAEAESAAISLTKGERYKVFQSKGISELLPDETSALVTEVVDTLDMIGKVAATGAMMKKAPALGEKITTKLITEYKLPKELFIDGESLRTELQTGGILPHEALEAYKTFGLRGEEFKAALRRGIDIKIPSKKIVTVTDRPWYAKVKKMFKMAPRKEVRVFEEGKPEYELGIEKKPEIKVPEEIKFKDSTEAEAFGREATSEQIKQLEVFRKKSASLRDQAMAAGENEIAMEHGMEVQRYNDAIRAYEGGQTLEEIKAAGKSPKEIERLTRRMEEEIPSPSLEDIRLEAAREIESPKTRIRLITGQTKISDLVREDVAFKASLRKAAKEARHALSVGKKEGYEKAKKHYLELRDRVKKREAQKRYVQKLINNITKPLGNSIDFAYKEAIENMREGIDPHFRAEKTLRAKERMQKFFADNPDKLAEMPVKFMRELAKKPLNDYTIDDIEQISDGISKLRKLGRTKRKLKLAQEERVFESDKDDMILAISEKGKGKPEGEGPIVKATRERAGRISSLRVLTLRPSRIFDRLDGGQQFSGPVHKFFYDEVNKGIDESYRGIDKRLGSGREMRKKLKISTRSLGQSQKIKGTKVTLDEMLDIYAGWKNPRKRVALMLGNNVTEEMYTEIASKLTDNQKAFADWVISEYENNYNRVREAHIENANEDMGYEPSYTPIRRTDVTPDTHKGELAQEILIRSNLKKAYIGRQFTYERKDIPKEFQRPLFLGLYSTWLDQVPKQERYVALGSKVKDLQKLTSDPDFRRTVRENFGPEYLDTLEHYNNRVANPSIYKAFSRVEKISQGLRKNMVVAYLSFNLVTMGKQLPSVLLYLPDAGPAHLIEAMLQFAANPLKTIRFVNDKDPQIKHRMIERELEEMKYSGKVIKKTGRSGMKGIRLMDKLAVTTGWLAVYNRNVGRVGEAEAIRLAQNATLRTQPAAHAKDLPEIYTSNEMLNWMLQFTNQLNQIYNIATYDIPQDVKRGRLYKALLSSLALGMVSLVIWTMTKRRLPEDKDDIVEALTEEAISAIPVAGKIILSASHGYEQATPAVKTAVAVGKLASNAERETKVKEMIEALFVATGTPYTGPKRVVEAITEEDAMLLLGHEKRKEKGRKRY